MRIHINGDSSVPVFQQIVDQVKAAVARGACQAGEMIPSVRQMAAQALVNPNTVAKAFRELERDGVIASRRGVGLVVTADAVDHCRQDRRRAIRGQLAETVLEARRAGISAEELQSDLERALRAGAKEDSQAPERAHRTKTVSSHRTPRSAAAAEQ